MAVVAARPRRPGARRWRCFATTARAASPTARRQPACRSTPTAWGWPPATTTTTAGSTSSSPRSGATRCCATSAGGSTTSPPTPASAGAPDQWSTCATWFDADNDGDLDLFVCHYVQWSREIDLKQDFSLAGIGRAYGPPRNFAGAAPAFYVNDGAGRFTDRAEAAGLVVTDPVTGSPPPSRSAWRSSTSTTDRCLDLVVANDTVRNFVFRNRCDGTFEEVGTTLGLAYDSYGNARSGMGIDVAEVRNDGAPAVAIGNFANEMTALYVTQPGSGLFADEAIPGRHRRAEPRRR